LDVRLDELTEPPVLALVRAEDEGVLAPHRLELALDVGQYAAEALDRKAPEVLRVGLREDGAGKNRVAGELRVGGRPRRGVDVEDPAADGVLAPLLDGGRALEAALGELAREPGEVQRCAHGENEARRVEGDRRGQLPQRFRERGDEKVKGSAAESVGLAEGFE